LAGKEETEAGAEEREVRYKAISNNDLANIAIIINKCQLQRKGMVIKENNAPDQNVGKLSII